MKEYNKQHPVPQNIASYQFRLVGDMTLKQFLELAAGLVTGWVIYSTNIPFFFKWPLIVFVVLLGAGLAFYPINELPLDHWIINFFRSIYSPTEYLWKKTPPRPELFTKEPVTVLKKKDQKVRVKDRAQLQEYLASLSTTLPPFLPEDEDQLNHLKRISQLLGTDQATAVDAFSISTQPEVITTDLKRVRVRKLGLKDLAKAPPIKPEKAKVVTEAPISVPIPRSKPIVEPAAPLSPPMLVQSRYTHKLDPAVAAQFSTTLPIPSTPESPNVVVGMVLTDLDKIIPSALIEIINSNGETVRALKSNKLGQFFSGIPLKNDSYQIKAEHPDHQFDIMEFKAEGKIILPFKVKAKKKVEL